MYGTYKQVISSKSRCSHLSLIGRALLPLLLTRCPDVPHCLEHVVVRANLTFLSAGIKMCHSVAPAIRLVKAAYVGAY